MRLSLCDRAQKHCHADRRAGIFVSRLRRRIAIEAFSSGARTIRADALSEFRGAAAALNAHDSNTGMNSVPRSDRSDRQRCALLLLDRS